MKTHKLAVFQLHHQKWMHAVTLLRATLTLVILEVSLHTGHEGVGTVGQEVVAYSLTKSEEPC